MSKEAKIYHVLSVAGANGIELTPAQAYNMLQTRAWVLGYTMFDVWSLIKDKQ